MGGPWATKNRPKMQTKMATKHLLNAPWSPKCFLARFLTLLDGLGSIFGWFLAPKPLGQIVPKTTSGTNRSKKQALGQIRQITPNQTLGQIVPKTSSGANHSTDIHRQSLGQIVPKTTSGTNRSQNNLSGAIRYSCTLYATSGTNPSKNKLCDKSSQN